MGGVVVGVGFVVDVAVGAVGEHGAYCVFRIPYPKGIHIV